MEHPENTRSRTIRVSGLRRELHQLSREHQLRSSAAASTNACKHAARTLLRINGNIRRAGTPARRLPAGLQLPLPLRAKPDTIEACGGKPTEAAEILRGGRGPETRFFGRRGGVSFGRRADLPGLRRCCRWCGCSKAVGFTSASTRTAECGIRPSRNCSGEVDLVLLDVKQITPERHRLLAGRENTQTLRTAAWLRSTPKPFWLRRPRPGVQRRREDVRALGERLGGCRMIERVELLPLPYARRTRSTRPWGSNTGCAT